MKIILVLVLSSLILVSCGKKSDPQYQSKANQQSLII